MDVVCDRTAMLHSYVSCVRVYHVIPHLLVVQSSSSFPPLPLLVATRFWGHTLDDLASLHAFLIRTIDYAQHVVVAINVEQVTQRMQT